MILYLHLRDSKIFFHYAKFGNIRDEKISDFKKKKLAGLKTGGLVGLWATFDEFFYVLGAKINSKKIFKNILENELKSYIK